MCWTICLKGAKRKFFFFGVFLLLVYWKVIKEKVEDIYMRSYNDENIVENGEPCKPSNNIINEQAMLKNHPELNDVRICQNGVPLYDDKFKHINELLQVGGLQLWCQVDIYL